MTSHKAAADPDKSVPFLHDKQRIGQVMLQSTNKKATFRLSRSFVSQSLLDRLNYFRFCFSESDGEKKKKLILPDWNKSSEQKEFVTLLKLQSNHLVIYLNAFPVMIMLFLFFFYFFSQNGKPVFFFFLEQESATVKT